MRPSKEYMARIFEGCGLLLTPSQLESFWLYHSLLRERNQELDLTRIFNFESMVIKHYVDCAVVTKYVSLPSPLMDLGSGAGLPGIPIKIMRPDLKVVLVEQRAKRVQFLQEVIQRLGLKDIEVIKKKLGPGFDIRVGGVITRALEEASKTLLRVKDIVEPNGLVVLMKGPKGPLEAEEAQKRLSHLYRLSLNQGYSLCNTQNLRTLLVFQRLYTHEKRPTVIISSAENPRFKALKRLITTKGIEEEGLCLVSGKKVVMELLSRHIDKVRAVLCKKGQDIPPLHQDLEVQEFSPQLFAELDLFGTDYPILLTATNKIRKPQGEADLGPIVLGLPFQDPANVGAAIRSAMAFGISRILLLKSCAHPFHPKSLRAGGSACFDLEYFGKVETKDLKDLKLPILALSPKGKDITRFKFPDRFLLIPGLEGPGLPADLEPHELLAIPMVGNLDSLNASVATGIALFYWRYQRGY